jgi:hypothetical protein
MQMKDTTCIHHVLRRPCGGGMHCTHRARHQSASALAAGSSPHLGAHDPRSMGASPGDRSGYSQACLLSFAVQLPHSGPLPNLPACSCLDWLRTGVQASLQGSNVMGAAAVARNGHAGTRMQWTGVRGAEHSASEMPACMPRQHCCTVNCANDVYKA